MCKRKCLQYLYFLFFIMYVVFAFCSPLGAQIPLTTVTLSTTANWVALPPYNTLWPLWSPALSPINSYTGLPTPIVTNLYPSTVLPVQPGLTWDPYLGHPWMLYNTPSGMVYYDPFVGINKWPASILQNSITGLPINLTLLLGYESLPATPVWWLLANVPAANWNYLTVYPSFSTSVVPSPVVPTLSSLLTPSDLLF